MSPDTYNEEPGGIAIIGMSCRFPGAVTPDQYWHIIEQGLETTHFFSEEELLAAGERPDLVRNPNYVRARGILTGVDQFDAAFFKYLPAEASLIDPQQRIFLECAWECLEDAGYDPEAYEGPIGVFGGVSQNTYFVNVQGGRFEERKSESVRNRSGREKDYLTTRVAYKLNLRGPAVTVQSACSTSLVSVHLACQSLLGYGCDMAVAGGSSIYCPEERGYLYEEGVIVSPDGRCRPFDAAARGTFPANGSGAVLLKRLHDALADGDHIYAVIRSSAINNDGSLKIGFTAPSIQGQAEVITLAHELAEIDPESIRYIEAHGTATALGDPIEVAALNEAFSHRTNRRQYCAIGSVKANFGHMDIAAGIAGLIKAALVVQHGKIPPCLHFEKSSPEIPFETSPFYVNTSLREWPDDVEKRVVAVSSFGMGGTNAHAILEEAPIRIRSGKTRSHQCLLLSAMTHGSLDAARSHLHKHLTAHPELPLADVACTLQQGRRAYNLRWASVCTSHDQALEALSRPAAPIEASDWAAVAFLFAGSGAQYPGMGRELYEEEPAYRRAVEQCLDILDRQELLNLKPFLFPDPEDHSVSKRLEQPSLAMPALFTTEYALAKLWMNWGIKPAALIGHSMGEYTAACLAGVLDLKDALALVTLRGRLLDSLPAGNMISVPLSEEELTPLLKRETTIAVKNGPNACVASGPAAAVEALENELTARGIDSVKLHIAFAGHSAMVEPILDEFERFARTIRLHPPQIPVVSNVTGRWMTDADALDPTYWVRHLRNTVRFSEGLACVLEHDGISLLEVGPGRTLTSLARSHPALKPSNRLFTSLRHPREDRHDMTVMLEALGHLWATGMPVDWQVFNEGLDCRRIPLPTYPFERKRYWASDVAIQTQESPTISVRAEAPLMSRDDLLPKLQQLVQSVSGISTEDQDPEATFVALGFDSLLLTQVTQAVKRTFEVSITFRRLLEDLNTPGALARYLESVLPVRDLTPAPKEPVDQVPAPAPRLPLAASQDGLKTEDVLGILRQQLHLMSEQLALLRSVLPDIGMPIPDDAVAILESHVPTTGESRDRLPLTGPQQEIWAAAGLGPERSAAYNEPTAYHLKGTLDVDALRKAIQDLVDRYEALRLQFASNGSHAEILTTVTLDVPLEDLSDLDHASRQRTVEEKFEHETTTPFDLTRAPLMRARILKLGQEEHILLLNYHHLVTDGWSYNLLRKALELHYSARKENRLPELSEASSFAGYMLAQQEESARSRRAESEAYWLHQFEDSVPVMDLPVDRPRTDKRSNHAGSYHHVLSDALTRNLSEYGATRKSTHYVVLLSAFYAFLHRITGQNDLVVGLPVAGQTIVPNGRGLVGHCVNILPFRFRPDGTRSFEALVSGIRNSFLDAFEHPDVTFGTLIRRLRIKRDPSRNPLVEVAFNLGRPGIPDRFADLALTLENPARRFGKLDLELYVTLGARTTQIEWRYNSDLFDAESVQHWAKAYEALLEAGIREPEIPVSLLPLMAPDVRHTILVEWNATDAPLPGIEPYHVTFERQCRREPSRTAVICQGKSLTYQELNFRANQIALRLRTLGARAGTRVGVHLDRSIELLPAIFAVLKTGATYVPLDPSLPETRLNWLIEDAGIEVVITRKSLAGVLASAGPSLLVLEDEAAAIAKAPGVDLPSTATPDDLLYMIYTSGSTGEPKGVVVSNCNLAYLLFAQDTFLKPDPSGGVWLASSGISFDASIQDFFWTLSRGFTVVLHPDVRWSLNGGDASDLVSGRAIHQYGVTHLFATPSLMRIMLTDADTRAALGTVRCILVGGEPLTPGLLSALREVYSGQLINEYGPTEATVLVTAQQFDEADGGPISIGRALPNVKLYVLDQYGQPVPPGVPGELFIGGPFVSQGYWRRPELTAERFVSDVFSADPKARLYRTGDRVRYLPDGTLMHLGRLDHQVKIRGNRIELGEIEKVLGRHPSVRECVASVHEFTPEERKIVAHVSLAAGIENAGEIRSYLRERLPGYMVPARIIVLDELPHTPGGKIDRSALPIQLDGQGYPHAETIPPQTPEEHVLTDVCRRILHLEEIGIQDNLFDLGADSMLVFQISEAVSQAGLSLEPHDFFRYQTVAELAAEANARRAHVASREDELRGLVKNMTPEQVRRLLEEKRGKSPSAVYGHA